MRRTQIKTGIVESMHAAARLGIYSTSVITRQVPSLRRRVRCGNNSSGERCWQALFKIERLRCYGFEPRRSPIVLPLGGETTNRHYLRIAKPEVRVGPKLKSCRGQDEHSRSERGGAFHRSPTERKTSCPKSEEWPRPYLRALLEIDFLRSHHHGGITRHIFVNESPICEGLRSKSQILVQARE